MAQRLWATAAGPESRSAWKLALSHYDAALAIRITQPRRPATELAELDQWYRKAVGDAVRIRGFMIREELVDVVRWKLLRGKFRPNLQKFAESNPPALVESCSRDAVEKCRQGKLGEAMACLCKLKGIGPATASAVLAAICPHAPFMADEAVVAVLGSIKYNVKVYDLFADELKKRHADVFGSGSAAKKDPDATTDEEEEEVDDEQQQEEQLKTVSTATQDVENGMSIADMSNALWASAFVPFDEQESEMASDDNEKNGVSEKNDNEEEEEEEVVPVAKRRRKQT